VAVESVPIELVQLWRVLVWAAELALLGSIVAFLPRAWRCRDREELMPRWTLLLYVATAVFLLQAAIQQAVRWEEPMRAEGLPLTTIAVAYCVWARRERAREGVS
jgi:hypothetical protein